MIRNSIYADFIMRNVPKILTQVDRDEDSPTYGSCDRNFWHLKIRDFSSAILQQTGLTLALLYKLNFKNNYLYNNKKVFEWAKSTVYYWKKIQLKDGSFNEYYPNEHGFPPTAFSLFTACETYKILGLSDEKLIESFKKTGRYLVKNFEKKASNQEMASITALYSLYTITKEEWVIEGVNKKLGQILETQSEEGWFPEYNGADFGYLSVTFDMLAEYYWQSKDERVIKPLELIVEFIKYFVHPDGTIGGEYGSRNTMYFLPYGLEVMISLGNKDAILIKEKIYREINSKDYFMNSIDDRYFSHYVLHSFLRALNIEIQNIEKPKDLLPFETNKIKFFKEAGLISFSNKNYYSVVSLRKGGLIKVFYNGVEKYIDTGYRIIEDKNEIATTNWLDNNYKIFFNCKNTAKVSGQFNLIKLQVSSPIKHFVLRCISFMFGKHIIGMLKKKLIFVDKHIDCYFNREIEFKENYIKISDEILSIKPRTIKSANTLSLRHVASGKFFKTTELIELDKIIIENIQKVRITKIIDTKQDKVDVKYEKLD